MVRELIAGYMMRAVLVLSLVCIFGGDMNCASPPVRQEVIAQQTKNENAKATAKRVVPPGKDQDEIVNALDDSSKLLDWTSNAFEKAKARADKNQAAADFVFWLKWIGRLAVVAAGIWGLLKIGQKIPIVRNWLPGS